MFVLYVDESGNFAKAEEEHVVLGGVLLHESAMRLFRRRVESVLTKHLEPPLAAAEIHAQWMVSGKGPWRGVPKHIRSSLLEELVSMLADLHLELPDKIECVAVVRQPGAIPGVDPLERIHEELLLRASQKAKRSGEWLMIVADESKYESRIQPMVRSWREGSGTRFGTLTGVAEVPLFVSSDESRMIQLADLVAHSVYRAYQRREGNLLDLLLSAFDRDPRDGRMHRFMHLTASFPECDCPACASRQQPVRASTVPAPDSSSPSQWEQTTLFGGG